MATKYQLLEIVLCVFWIKICCFTCLTQVCSSWYLTCCYKHGFFFSSVKLLSIWNCTTDPPVKWCSALFWHCPVFPVTELFFWPTFASLTSVMDALNVYLALLNKTIENPERVSSGHNNHNMNTSVNSFHTPTDVLFSLVYYKTFVSYSKWAINTSKSKAFHGAAWAFIYSLQLGYNLYSPEVTKGNHVLTQNGKFEQVTYLCQQHCIFQIKHLPPSLPLAQHCGNTDWPLHIRCPPHHYPPLLQGLKTQRKEQCHNHRKPLSYIHWISRRAGNKHCKVSQWCTSWVHLDRHKTFCWKQFIILKPWWHLVGNIG